MNFSHHVKNGLEFNDEERENMKSMIRKNV